MFKTELGKYTKLHGGGKVNAYANLISRKGLDYNACKQI